MTDLLYLRDAYLTTMDASVVATDGKRVALDRTVFYPTGGGQPHDTGRLDGVAVTDVRKEGETVWHTLDGPLPDVGRAIHGEVDWPRRHALMRTHTALHVLCGVIWNGWGTAVTGGNMEPLAARMDFEFDPLPEEFGTKVEEQVNAELAAARPLVISFIPRAEAVARRRPDPHQGQPHPGVGAGDPGRRHRGTRQAGRRRDPCRAHGRGRAHRGPED